MTKATTETVDFPWVDAIKEANKMILQGYIIYQKFTCANCKARQVIDEPNRFYENATCEECKHETSIKTHGCNFMLVATL